MALPSLSYTLDSFYSSTLLNFQKGLAKNFIEYRPIVKLLMDDYGHKDSGGWGITAPVEYGANANTKFISPYDAIDTTPTENATTAIYPWRHMASSAAVSDIEAIANTGQERIFELFKTRVRGAIRSMANLLGSECYSDGTSNAGNTIVGLAAGVSTTPLVDPASGAVGGIAAATNPFWRNNATVTAGSFAANGVNGGTTDLVINQFNNCTDGMVDKPTFAISDQATWQYYNRTLLATVRYLDPEHAKMGDMSFKALEYEGIPWYWDRQCPAGRMYFINTNYIHFYTDPGMFFTWTESRTWPNQLTRIRLVVLRCALIYKSRMFHAVLDGWTA